MKDEKTLLLLDDEVDVSVPFHFDILLGPRGRLWFSG
jgi:hypothetical protein